MSDPRARARSATGTAEHVRVELDRSWPAAWIRADAGWTAIHGQRDPVAEAGRHLGALPDDAPAVALVGLGLGYALDALEARGWRGRVIAIEPEPALVTFFRARRDWSAWDARLTLFPLDTLDEEKLRQALAGLTAPPPRVTNPVLARTHAAEVARAHSLLDRAWFAHDANEQARRDNAGRYLLNTLRNATTIASEADAAALDDLYTGLPAVVVGAGPSLDEAIPALQQFPDRAVLIAVDTALRPLLDAGVPPHLGVAIDPTEANARHLCELPPCAGTALVAEGSLDPLALRTFAGRTFFGRVGDHAPWPWLREAGLDVAVLRAWGSVLTTAVDVALRVGANPLVFAGADLAFSGGQPYARGTTYEEDWRRATDAGRDLPDIWAEQIARWEALHEAGVAGRREPTARHLRAFRDWIAARADETRERRFVNASGRGILVGSRIEQASLVDILAAMPPVQVASPATRWRRRGRTPQVGAAITSVLRDLAAGSVDRPPVPAWRAFAPDVAATAVRDALKLQTPDAQLPPETLPVAASDEIAWQAAWTAEGWPSHRIAQVISPRDRALLRELAGAVAPKCVHAEGPHGIVALALLSGAAAGARLTFSGPAHAEAALARVVERLGRREALGTAGPGRPDIVVVSVDDAATAPARVLQALDLVRPGGHVVVHDALGSDGGLVARRATLDVLEARPDWRLVDRRFVDFESRLAVFCAFDGRGPLARPDVTKSGAEHQVVADMLAPLVVECFSPATVLDLGAEAGLWEAPLTRAGVRQYVGVDRPSLVEASTSVAVSACDPWEYQAPARFDLCLCLGVGARTPADRVDDLVRAAVAASDVVLFYTPAPGSGRVGLTVDQPLAFWAAKFWRHGYAPDDAFRSLLERRGGYRSQFHMATAFRRVLDADTARELQTQTALAEAVRQSVRRTEALVAQVFWASLGLPYADAREPRPVVLPPARLRPVAPGVGYFAFRSRLARRRGSLSHIEVFEGEYPLTRLDTEAELRASRGAFVVGDGELWLASTDGTSPRANGREYVVHVPPEIAFLERQSRDTVLKEGL